MRSASRTMLSETSPYVQLLVGWKLEGVTTAASGHSAVSRWPDIFFFPENQPKFHCDSIILLEQPGEGLFTPSSPGEEEISISK